MRPGANLTPQQRRERLIVSNLLTLRARGIAVDPVAVERMVIAELELVDAADRAGELGNGQRAKPDARPSAVRPDLLAEAQRDTGTRLIVDRDIKPDNAPHRYRPAVLHQNPLQRSVKWSAAIARMKRILEGVIPGKSLVQSVKNAEYPDLAAAWLELYAFYMTRSRPPAFGRTDHNPFRGLSDKDAARMFEAKIYDICDRSTGRAGLGSWYVK